MGRVFLFKLSATKKIETWSFMQKKSGKGKIWRKKRREKNNSFVPHYVGLVVCKLLNNTGESLEEMNPRRLK